MTSISELLLANIDSITENYAVNIGEPSKAIVNLRDELLAKGETIHPFHKGSLISEKSLVAIDGGRVTQKLAGGDLIIVGATVGEGYQSKQLFFDSDDIPAEAYSAVLPHTSANQNVEAAVMAALELRLFQKVKADVKIIDGAYLGNVSQVLFTLIGSSQSSSDLVLSLNNFDEDGLLKEAIKSILQPSRHDKKDYVAIAKSDSSFVFSKELLGKDSELAKQISDRILASRLLHSGEVLQPRALASNPNLINSLERFYKTDYRKNSINAKLLTEFISEQAGFLRRLDDDRTEEKVLYSTYFKPSAWDDYAPAINIQFVHFREYGMTVLERAQELISYIDQDILQESMLEPWSQYNADLRAKDVSNGANLVKEYLIASATTQHELTGLLRGYRS